MKNLLVGAVTVPLVYLLWDALPQPPPPPLVPVVAVATPAPAAAPKLYFHSALEASAMSPRQHTGTSYFSTDSDSRFNAGYASSGYGWGGAYAGGGTTIVMLPTGQAANGGSRLQRSSLAAPAVSVVRTTASYDRHEPAKTAPHPAGDAR